jgi:mRNA-degrading endonuclease toxin of MazEF toxin-antitoxin module
MAAYPTRGEVWLVDLGMVAKVRPCLVFSIPADGENDRVLTTVIPHTTSTRESRFEVLSDVRFLKAVRHTSTIASVNCGSCHSPYLTSTATTWRPG